MKSPESFERHPTPAKHHRATSSLGAGLVRGTLVVDALGAVVGALVVGADLSALSAVVVVAAVLQVRLEASDKY